MAELTERLSRWNIHPDITVTHRFKLDQAAEAYRVADQGQSGKVAIVFE
jgi:threonine dehydrogenase-like Zn-dependent dehydrogenase